MRLLAVSPSTDTAVLLGQIVNELMANVEKNVGLPFLTRLREASTGARKLAVTDKRKGPPQDQCRPSPGMRIVEGLSNKLAACVETKQEPFRLYDRGPDTSSLPTARKCAC
jgi:two-component sensor histidine kinase